MALVLLLPQAFAATATELFEDGNRLFRDDLYWAALLRYRQASDAGMDTPLLHYNSGVAHYKAEQYIRARESLLKASQFGPIQPLAHYNLGLNAYKLDDLNEAVRWFRQARDQEQNKQVSRLARRALAQIRREVMSDNVTETPQVARVRERELTRFDLRAEIGAGLDDNVFRSPDQPYIDQSDPALPLVTPNVQEGVFIPVRLRAKYQVNALENEGFFGAYRLNGRFYQDKNLVNANEYLHEFSFGSEYAGRWDNRARRVYSAFKIAQHEETYYDRDTGVEEDIGGIFIGDRLSYLRYGPEFWIRETFGPFSIGGRARGQLWNYESLEQDVAPEYDYEYWQVGLNAQYLLTETSLLRVTAEYYTRRYGDRPAFELDGTQPLGNPTIRYDYTDYSVLARQRITRSMWFSFGYAKTDRKDHHVGYNNYTRDEYNAEFHLGIGDRFSLDARGYYRLYDYENAFAFHNPAAGTKTLETASGSLAARFRMTDNLLLVGELLHHEVSSTDTRIQYDRNQIHLGVRWFQ